VMQVDPKERRTFLSSAPLRAAHGLCLALGLNEANYRGLVGHIYRDPRAYFLYGCMDEVLKVSTASMRWAEFVDSPEEEVKKLVRAHNLIPHDPGLKHVANLPSSHTHSIGIPRGPGTITIRPEQSGLGRR
jgi:hypothetical protein